jgi:hypothetical protein
MILVAVLALDDVTQMQPISTRLLHAGDSSLLLHGLLEAAIEITGAQMGNIQLLNGDRPPHGSSARGSRN